MDTHHPLMTQAAIERADASATEPTQRRIAVKCEIESELRGLMMAARMHGFTICISGTTLGVVDQQGAA